MVKTNGLATASLVFGILPWVMAWIPFVNFSGILWSILAIIFGALALKAIKEKPEELKGKGLAIAGLVLGIVGLIPTILVILLCGSLCAAGGAGMIGA